MAESLTRQKPTGWKGSQPTLPPDIAEDYKRFVEEHGGPKLNDDGTFVSETPTEGQENTP